MLKPYFYTYAKYWKLSAALLAAMLCFIAVMLALTKDDKTPAQEIYYNTAVLPENQHYQPRPLAEIEAKQNQQSPVSKAGQQKAETLFKQRQDPLVGDFLGLNEGGFNKASQAAEAIFDRGNSDDLTFLVAALSLERPEAFSDDEWQALQSRSIDYLVDERKTPGGTEEQLLSLIESSDASDYVKRQVVNNIHTMYKYSEQGENLKQKLWQITAKPESDLAATALTSLARISYQSNSVDTENLKQKAVELSRSKKANLSTRVVAMEAATWLNSSETQAQAMDILNDGQQPELLQLAAIQTLVASGNTEGLPLLEQLAASNKPGLKRAATHAISLINAGGADAGARRTRSSP